MKEKLLKAISQFSMLDGAKRVTVALSGGADSVALLNILFELREELDITLSAAHFNHKIRGEEADRDERFVGSICSALGVPLYCGNADVVRYAKENRLSVELAARKLRYEFFESIDTDVIATAHTASDNTETVLFNIVRGTALDGLCGIPPVRDRYIRPLILCSRDDIENYCKINSLEYVTDSTNLCDEYTRNSIRHNVIPYLKKINPSLELSVSRLTNSLTEDADFIKNTACAEFENRICNDDLDVKDIQKLPISLAKRVIKYYCEKHYIQIDSFHLNEIYRICQNGGKTAVSGNNSAVCNGEKLTIIANNEAKQNVEFKVVILKHANNFFQNGEKVHNLFLKNAFDCDKIIGKLVIRTRLSGDKVRLANKNGTKSLKKLFTEYKVPQYIRDCLPVISDDEGVVWIYSIGVADRCAVRPHSKEVYSVKTETIFLGDNNE